MADNRFVPPTSTLEVLEHVPESVLRRLKQYSGRLATEAVHAMEERLPFFGELEAFAKIAQCRVTPGLLVTLGHAAPYTLPR